jgi:hypothetical protein
MSGLALTDTNALYGALPFYTLAREMGIKPIIGAVLDEPENPARYAVLLARNRAGYSQLCQAITDRQLKPISAYLTACGSTRGGSFASPLNQGWLKGRQAVWTQEGTPLAYYRYDKDRKSVV